MGVNMVGYAIVDDEVCREASRQEILRRYFSIAGQVRKGDAAIGQLQKLEMLMRAQGLEPEMRRTVPAARELAQKTGEPAVAIELSDGKLITGKTSDLMGASCAALLNSLKYLAGIADQVKLIAPAVLQPITHLKVEHLGNRNPRLHTDEILIALSMCAATNPTADLAMEYLSQLKDAQVHSTVILSQVDEKLWRKLGANVTCDPVYEGQKLYHK